MAGGAADAHLVMLGVPIHFGIRMLHLRQKSAGLVVFEVLERSMFVEVVNPGDIHQREEVRTRVVHLDGFAGSRIGTRVAVVFNVALSAHEFAVRFAEDRDLTCEAAETHVFHVDRCLIGRFRIERRVIGASHGLDQCVADDTGLSTVRVMAHIAVHSMIDVVNQINRVGSTAPLSLGVRVA